MQKKSLFALFFTLASLDFVSAAYYGSFSLGNFLNSIDSSTAVLGIVLVVSFAVINLALSRMIKDNKTIASVISLALALGITWALNNSGVNYYGSSYNFFSGIGFPSDLFYTIVWLIFWGAVIFAMFKFGFLNFLIGSGVIIMLMGLLGLVYQTGALVFVGIVLTGLGVVLKYGKKMLGFGKEWTKRDEEMRRKMSEEGSWNRT